MKTQKLKVVGYARVSTEEQATQGVSLAAQRAKIVGYCALYDLELVEVIEDAGISGGTLARPGLTRALAMLQAGKAGGLVIVKLDRLTRSVSDWAALIQRWFNEKKGKSLLSVGDQIDTRSASGRLVLNVLISVSEWEREAIAERTSAALQHMRRMGQVYGTVPLGYAAEDGRLVPVVEEMATVERARELRHQGLSLRKVTAKLTEEGRRTKDGGPWHLTTVVRLLKRQPVGEGA